MTVQRKILGALLGTRLPVTAGSLRVEGIDAPVTIRRDRHGIPSIEADGDGDAAFAVGFCHGQDRTFQLEILVRVVRGTAAALLGRDALAVDRLSRRISFRRNAADSLARTKDHNRQWIEGYTAGINSALELGLHRRPHEFALLRATPTPWEPADVVGVARLFGFLLPTNWDQELVRLKVLHEDGHEALLALDPAYPPDGPAHDTPGVPAGTLVDRLAADLEQFAETVNVGGGSNAFAVSGDRTAPGRPLLAGDPHLAPAVPPHWYLQRVRTPEWGVAGATLVGAPAVLSGHNGHGAWSLTSGVVDNTDLFIEEVSGDRVRRGDTFVPCERRTETIEVRGSEPVTIDVLETSNGPIISPDVTGVHHGLAMRATWLAAHPLDVFDLHRARTFEQFRDVFHEWDGLSLNLVWVDASDRIGWQLIGRPPRRRRGHGTIPMAGWDEENGWEQEPEAYDRLPWAVDPPAGYVVSANQLPTAREDVYLGRDWLEPYRAQRIAMMLRQRADWDVAGIARLQQDVMALPWWEIRDTVLAAPASTEEADLGRDLLEGWGGKVAPDSAAATVFEFLVAELNRRVAETVAPNSARWALGEGMTALTPFNFFPKLRYAHLASMLREGTGPLDRAWPEEIDDALGTVIRTLRDRFGPDPADWRWGTVKAWHLPHLLGGRTPLKRIFDIGPVPGAGDHTTPAQHGVVVDDPAAAPAVHPSLRVVVDVGNWEASRFALPGGQSGNPLSPHYDDQLPAFLDGTGVPIPWSDTAARRAARRVLRLEPGSVAP